MARPQPHGVFQTALALGAALVLLLSTAQAVPAAPSASSAGVDKETAIVQLVGDPLSISPKTKPPQGKKVDFDSAATKSERARLRAIRQDFKTWLRANAPSVRINSEYDVAIHAMAVSLNGTSLTTLRAAPMVVAAENESFYTPLAHEDPDLSQIFVNEAWTQVGGASAAGAGVKVGVIDSGIDASHPCFSDAGYPTQTRLGDTALTNNKVIVARVFNNTIKKNDLTAEAIGYHGNHVAGTIACNAHTPATIDGIAIPYDPSGVAPRALLGSYNVFPGNVVSARSEDILNALQAAYEDGMDIVNMSLGGQQNDGGGGWLLANAVDNLDQANMLSAVAAGNEGPGNFTVGFPGAARRALTVGASTVGQSIVNQVTVAGSTYEAVVGDFGELTSDLTAPLKVVPDTNPSADPTRHFPHGLSTACNDDPALPSLTGTIALLGRGVCDFSDKVGAAEAAGAVGVIMVDRIEEAPFGMATNGAPDQPKIPAVMIRLTDGLVAKTHDGGSATLIALPAYARNAALDYQMADFSSQGPTMGQNVYVKPDVVAPGHNVISSIPASYCDGNPSCWAVFSGTSMATPHMAGLAALVRAAHLTWSAAQVRSAIVNTAQEDVLRTWDTDKVTNDAVVVGAGLADAYAAWGAKVALDPVSISFGSIPGTSGRSDSAALHLTNLTASSQTYTVAISDDGADGVLFSGGGTLTLSAGASANVPISIATNKGAADGNRQAAVRVSTASGEIAHAVAFALIGSGTGAPGQHLLPPSQLK